LERELHYRVGPESGAARALLAFRTSSDAVANGNFRNP
jgi:hypothetical protein